MQNCSCSETECSELQSLKRYVIFDCMKEWLSISTLTDILCTLNSKSIFMKAFMFLQSFKNKARQKWGSGWSCNCKPAQISSLSKLSMKSFISLVRGGELTVPAKLEIHQKFSILRGRGSAVLLFCP